MQRLAARTRKQPLAGPIAPILIGSVSRSRVWLRQCGPLRNDLRPVFYGAFLERNGRTVLSGAFRTQLRGRVGLTIWFGGLAFMALAVFLYVLTCAPAKLWAVGAVLFFIPVGIATVLFGHWLGRKEPDWIAEQIHEAVTTPTVGEMAWKR